MEENKRRIIHSSLSLWKITSNKPRKRPYLADTTAPDGGPNLEHGVVYLLVSEPCVAASLRTHDETKRRQWNSVSRTYKKQRTARRTQVSGMEPARAQVWNQAVGHDHRPSRRQFRGGPASCCRGTSPRTSCTESHHAHEHVTSPPGGWEQNNNNNFNSERIAVDSCRW